MTPLYFWPTSGLVVMLSMIAIAFLTDSVSGEEIETVPSSETSIFAPVWSILYVMIGVVGARMFLDHRRSAAMRLWLAQMILNFLWSPLFFGMQDIASALIVIIALVIAVAGFVVASWQRDRISALLFLPYLAWVAFATALNSAILLMN